MGAPSRSATRSARRARASSPRCSTRWRSATSATASPPCASASARPPRPSSNASDPPAGNSARHPFPPPLIVVACASIAGLGDKAGAVTALKKYVSLEKRPQAKKFVDEAQATITKLEPPPEPPPAPPAPSYAGGGTASGDAAALKAEADSLKNQKRF